MENKPIINKIEIDSDLDTCPVCGYSDGFHVSFKMTEHGIDIILICPDCHARFDPSWKWK